MSDLVLEIRSLAAEKVSLTISLGTRLRKVSKWLPLMLIFWIDSRSKISTPFTKRREKNSLGSEVKHFVPDPFILLLLKPDSRACPDRCKVRANTTK